MSESFKNGNATLLITKPSYQLFISKYHFLSIEYFGNNVNTSKNHKKISNIIQREIIIKIIIIMIIIIIVTNQLFK